jgi:2-succinyl-6-hydroxy-2,4-cyclohexadiene-1-carboxylate synthase
LLGYSLGGRLALQWAARNAATLPQKIAALVLIGASPGIADAAERERRRQSDEALAHEILRDGIEAFLTHWWSGELFAGLTKNLSASALSALRERRLRNTPEALAASLRYVGNGVLPPVWSALPLLRVPVLCIAGEHDAKFRAIAAQMAAHLPDARTATISAAWHLPHLENPAETAACLQQFFAP